MSKVVLLPLPLRDFDPTESAVPWKALQRAGVRVVVATPEGTLAECDPLMLTGRGLGLLAGALKADRNGADAYREFSASTEFLSPVSWSDLRATDFDGVVLPGGHAKGMRPYLESPVLQKLVAEFFALNRPVGAICHGVVLASRALVDGHSVLRGRQTTALLSSQELLAWSLTRWWLGDYYRTYAETVEAEVRRSLAAATDFIRGPLPLVRDSFAAPGFTLRDGNYLSARWPGDAHGFGLAFAEMVLSRG